MNSLQSSKVTILHSLGSPTSMYTQLILVSVKALSQSNGSCKQRYFLASDFLRYMRAFPVQVEEPDSSKTQPTKCSNITEPTAPVTVPNTYRIILSLGIQTYTDVMEIRLLLLTKEVLSIQLESVFYMPQLDISQTCKSKLSTPRKDELDTTHKLAL